MNLFFQPFFLQHFICPHRHITVMTIDQINIFVFFYQIQYSKCCFLPGPVSLHDSNNLNIRIGINIFQKCLCTVDLWIRSLQSLYNTNLSFFTQALHSHLACHIRFFGHTSSDICCNIFCRNCIHFHIQINNRNSCFSGIFDNIKKRFCIYRTEYDRIYAFFYKRLQLFLLFRYTPSRILHCHLVIRIMLCFCFQKISQRLLIARLF